TPLQCIRDTRRKTDVNHIDFIRMGERAEFHGSGINESIGPGELETVEAFLEREETGFLDECEVNGVVDRELNGITAGEGDDVDASFGRKERAEDKQSDGREEARAAAETKYGSMPAWLASLRNLAGEFIAHPAGRFLLRVGTPVPR